ncbi:MAG: tRNA glutamyl-Q(34) synthetase GluQRS [Planctomycetes bacterium]|nr:tRNA glutamyl-Q(34) synthetase GluQRS [Planctomycetota bacterium]
MNESTTRLAPSPTGALHLGNARTFLINYLLARQLGWRIIMRIEDLDGPRVKADAADKAIETLRWLGLTWHGQVVYQSQRSDAYRLALDQLIESGHAYPCVCSRKDIALAATAPHGDEHVTAYPNTCRGRFTSARQAAAEAGRPPAWRVQVDDKPVIFRDKFCGRREFDLLHLCGDFVIYRGSGLAAYQLAVVVDDADAGVDAIVRGDDLLGSAAMQIHLRRLLDLSPEPAYWHVPLVLGPDGRRLAKRHGDTRVDHYRQLGATRRRVLGLLGYWCGALDKPRETTMDELIDRFDITRMSPRPIVFTPEDDAFLKGQ